jgi:uncharacterized protein with FMN-binding domain
MEQRNNKKDLIVTLAVLLVVVLVVGGAIAFNKKDPKATASTGTSTSTSQVAADSTTTGTTDTSKTFKDGTYTATGDYDTPEESENIKVTVTLKDGTITDTSATPSARSNDAKEYSGIFVQNYKSLVVGKNISTVSLNRVSGSSLTSQGFNRAIEQIKTQAAS